MNNAVSNLIETLATIIRIFNKLDTKAKLIITSSSAVFQADDAKTSLAAKKAVLAELLESDTAHGFDHMTRNRYKAWNGDNDDILSGIWVRITKEEEAIICQGDRWITDEAKKLARQ